MPLTLRAMVCGALVACGGVAATAATQEAASPLEPIEAPAPAPEPVVWDGGDVCAFDADGPPPPCDRRKRFGRPNRVYVGEVDALERLLAETPVGTPDHERILLRLASDYLDLACIAHVECLRSSLAGRVTRQEIRAGETARAAQAKLRARCDRYRREYQREPDPSLCS
jgi:hypothetical protein